MLAVPLLLGIAATAPSAWHLLLAVAALAGYLAAATAQAWLRARRRPSFVPSLARLRRRLRGRRPSSSSAFPALAALRGRGRPGRRPRGRRSAARDAARPREQPRPDGDRARPRARGRLRVGRLGAGRGRRRDRRRGRLPRGDGPRRPLGHPGARQPRLRGPLGRVPRRARRRWRRSPCRCRTRSSPPGLLARAVALPVVERRRAGTARPLRPVQVGIVEIVASTALVVVAFAVPV